MRPFGPGPENERVKRQQVRGGLRASLSALLSISFCPSINAGRASSSVTPAIALAKYAKDSSQHGQAGDPKARSCSSHTLTKEQSRRSHAGRALWKSIESRQVPLRHVITGLSKVFK